MVFILIPLFLSSNLPCSVTYTSRSNTYCPFILLSRSFHFLPFFSSFSYSFLSSYLPYSSRSNIPIIHSFSFLIVFISFLFLTSFSSSFPSSHLPYSIIYFPSILLSYSFHSLLLFLLLLLIPPFFSLITHSPHHPSPIFSPHPLNPPFHSLPFSSFQ